MGVAPSSPIMDWTNHTGFGGGLTRKQGKTAVVSLIGAVLHDDGAGDLDPAATRQPIALGLFRVPAMDDGQPDPVHAAHLLSVQFGLTQRVVHITASWGNLAIGTASKPPKIGDDTAPVVALWHLSPMQVQNNLKAIRLGGAA